MAKAKKKYDPKIVAFLCNWCGYVGTDLKQVDNSSNIKIVRIICSGRIQPALILDSFNHGSDGVLICGCYTDNCHYIYGNVRADEKVEKTKKLLDHLGIEPERVKLELVPITERAKFIDIIKNFNEQLISFGPIEIEN